MLPNLATIVFGSSLTLPAAVYAQSAPQALALCRDTHAEVDQRISACTAYIATNPRDTDNLESAFCNRALGEALNGNFDAALRDDQHALRLRPHSPQAFFNRGYDYYRLGSYNHAIRDYTTAIDLKPDFALAYVWRGVAHEGSGDSELALADYSGALHIDPRNFEAHHALGMYYLRRNKFDLAITEFTDALAQRSWPFTQYARGVAERMRGDQAASAADMASAARSDPQVAKEFERSATLQRRSNSATEASHGLLPSAKPR